MPQTGTLASSLTAAWPLPVPAFIISNCPRTYTSTAAGWRYYNLSVATIRRCPFQIVVSFAIDWWHCIQKTNHRSQNHYNTHSEGMSSCLTIAFPNLDRIHFSSCRLTYRRFRRISDLHRSSRVRSHLCSGLLASTLCFSGESWAIQWSATTNTAAFCRATRVILSRR